MIQVLNKAFRVLEYISKEPERAHPLNELAGVIGVSPASCSHLVKTLVNNAYLEQAEKRQGYKLGPMAYYLSRNGSYRQDLVRRIEPFLIELSTKTGEASSVSRIHNMKKYVLASCRSSNPIQIEDSFLYLDSLYQTATGRVLLAHQERSEQKRLLVEHGLPTPLWNGANDEKDFFKLLDQIKKEDVYIFEPLPELVFMATPIYVKEKLFGALALSLPSYRMTPDKRYSFSGAILEYAEKIKTLLSDFM